MGFNHIFLLLFTPTVVCINFFDVGTWIPFLTTLNEIIQPLLSLRVKKDHRIPQPNISDQSWPPFSRKEFTEMRRPVPSMIPLHVLLYCNWTKYYRHFKGMGKLSTENGQATRLWYRSSRVLLISEEKKKIFEPKRKDLEIWF